MNQSEEIKSAEAVKTISIWDWKQSKLRNWFGSRYKVMRQCDLDVFMLMYSNLLYLGELHTRCRLVYHDEAFRAKQVEYYNKKLTEFKVKYPDIWDFQARKIEPVTPPKV